MTETSRAANLIPRVGVAASVAITLGLAVIGAPTPWDALRIALLVGLGALIVAMVVVSVVNRHRLASLAAELDTLQRHAHDADRRARVLADSRRDLVGWVSADLQAPLSRLRTTVVALADGLLAEPDEVAAALSSIRHDADQMSDLLGDLSELSQSPAAGAHDDRASMADLVSEVAAGPTPGGGSGPPDDPSIFDLVFGDPSTPTSTEDDVGGGAVR